MSGVPTDTLDIIAKGATIVAEGGWEAAGALAGKLGGAGVKDSGPQIDHNTRAMHEGRT